MKFDAPLQQATFRRRYKRFLVDAEIEGELVVAHSTNTGTLRGCLSDGARALLAYTAKPGRKLDWTFRAIEVEGVWVGVDTSMAVPLVEEALAAGLLDELHPFDRMTREVKYGVDGKSRIDLLLSTGGTQVPLASKRARPRFEGDRRIYVEVKSTTLVEVRDGVRVGMFPDAVTARGLKHLHELIAEVRNGQRAAMVYVVQRPDVEVFAPAAQIDPAYAAAFVEAQASGVEFYALRCQLTESSFSVDTRIPLRLDEA
ncbi:MAG: DNA/RNA nuclease SfsA [Nannocystaceae bacterium]